MLNSTKATPLTTAYRVSVSGQYLAKNKLPKTAKRRLARAIIEGRVTVEDLTGKQIARLCRISAPAKPAPEAIASAWAGATEAERTEFIRRVGTEEVWSVLVGAM